ncbi:MAG: hypothetical protein ACHQAY_06380 [Hyphomicrobiales bacterium]
MNAPDVVGFLKAAYPDEPWPKPFHVLKGLQLLASGQTAREAAKTVGTSLNQLEKAARSAHPELDILGLQPDDLAESDLKKASIILGQLLIGRAAEIAFEDIYRAAIGQDAEFKLIDLRVGRTDTDYRVLNGRNRPIYRINIKFIGSMFRRAEELVGLDPEDCFPLATYKIFGALQKQEEEHLPYIFAIVEVPNLTAVSIQNQLASADIQIVALFSKSQRVPGKRNIEDKVVERIVAEKSRSFTEVYDKIRAADWYVLSARKADNLLRKLLFERVYAMKIRGFAQQFRGAELDMRFSLKNDLVKFGDFLRTLKEEGQTKMASLLERGTF